MSEFIQSITDPKNRPVVASVVVYSLCSSLMLLSNKALMVRMPGLASALTFLQLFFSEIFLITAAMTKNIDLPKQDLLIKSDIVKVYIYYALGFVAGLYSNMRALAVAKVETIIVFRSLLPLAVSVLDYQYLGRELPKGQSLMSLIAILLGGFGYVSTDKEISLESLDTYKWVMIWFGIMCFNMTYGKQITNTVKLSLWGNVHYSTFISLPFLFPYTILNGELFQIFEPLEDGSTMAILLVSSIIGVAIGYSSWWCRSSISATSFTIVGVLNKFLTVLLNIIIFPEMSASLMGLICLAICLIAGTFYKQPPLRQQVLPQQIPMS